MLKPIFIDKVLDNGKIIYEAKPQVMVDKIASDKAIDMMTRALVKAVEKGTAKSIFTPNLKMAGKTGTARFEYWIPGTRKYQASFAGFYPADKPLYTCLVMINQPDISIGYYGSTVSAPVFKEIAGRTFLKMPQNIDINPNTKPVDLKKLIPKQEKISVKNNIMPNIIGSVGAYTISQLENEGYRVKYEGVGRVKEQFPIPDTKLKKGQRIYLVLDR
jgi:cell division protein ftsI (peptidoglycan synthetase)